MKFGDLMLGIIFQTILSCSSLLLLGISNSLANIKWCKVWNKLFHTRTLNLHFQELIHHGSISTNITFETKITKTCLWELFQFQMHVGNRYGSSNVLFLGNFLAVFTFSKIGVRTCLWSKRSLSTFWESEQATG